MVQQLCLSLLKRFGRRHGSSSTERRTAAQWLDTTEYYCTFLEASPWDWANPLLWNILGVNRRIPKALGSNVFINAHFHPLGTKQFPPVCTSVFTFRIWGLRGGKPLSHTVLKDLLHHSVIATQLSIIANLQQNSFNKPLHYSKSAQHCSADSASSWSSWDILRHSVRCYPAQPSLWTSRSHVIHERWLEMHKPIAISLEQTLKNHQSPTFQRSIRAWNDQNITLLSVLPFPQHVRQKCILVQHGVATWRSIALSLISWASVPRADRGWPWHLWRCRTWLLRHLRTLWCLSWELRWAQRISAASGMLKHLLCWRGKQQDFIGNGEARRLWNAFSYALVATCCFGTLHFALAWVVWTTRGTTKHKYSELIRQWKTMTLNGEAAESFNMKRNIFDQVAVSCLFINHV